MQDSLQPVAVAADHRSHSSSFQCPQNCCHDLYLIISSTMEITNIIIELVDSICRDSVDMQYMLIQTNVSKSPKQLTYTPL